MEQLEVYDLAGQFLGVQGIKDFYTQTEAEYTATGQITRQVKIVHCLLMHSDGRVYVQRRNPQDLQNPNLLDKTVGGHISAGDTPEATLHKECQEEIGVPVVLADDLSTIHSAGNLVQTAVCRVVNENAQFASRRIRTDGTDFIQPYIVTTYIGYYDGAFQFNDTEAVAIETWAVADLQQALTNTPEQFTNDLRLIVEAYQDYLQPLKKEAP